MGKKAALGKGIESLIKNNAKSALLQNFSLDEQISKKVAAETKVPEAGKAEVKTELKREEPKNEENSILMVAPSEIKANEQQPRKIFKDIDLKELSDSIKENGIIQPLVVSKDEKGFTLIAGERRLRASKMAGLELVPVIIKRVTEKSKLALAIIENVQRSDLNCVEEALAYYKLVQDYSLTQEEVAKTVGKERSTVANLIRILSLPRAVIELLQKEILSLGHAKLLVALKDSSRAEKLAKRVTEEQLSVRDLETLIKDKPIEKVKTQKEVDEQVLMLRDELEKKTGYHLALKMSKRGKGELKIKFSSKDEFNKIYDHLLTKQEE